MKSSRAPLSSRVLAAFREGEVTRSEAEQIEARLGESAISRRRLAHIDRLRNDLSAVPDELAGVDLVAGVRRAIADPAPAPARVRRSILWASAGLVGFAAIAVLVAWPLDPSGDGVRDKSAGRATAIAEDRWVGIEVFRIDSGGVARPVVAGAALRSDDRLVFRYTNLGDQPFGYAMVFGVDATGEVHWYYPAYDVAGSDPRSLAIRTGGAVAMPDAVQHELPAGPLVIYGVFSRDPLSVVDVERRIAAQRWDPAAPPRAPIPGAGQDMIRLSVIR